MARIRGNLRHYIVFGKKPYKKFKALASPVQSLPHVPSSQVESEYGKSWIWNQQGLNANLPVRVLASFQRDP
jgi:hypothetical protein